MAPVVLDCSVVVDVLAGADRAHLARRVAHDEWHAPMLLDYEVVAALRGLVLGGHLTPGRAVDALVDLADLPITRWQVDVVTQRRALALRDRVTAYDAAYLVCAEGIDGALVTRDRRLARAAAELVEVRLL